MANYNKVILAGNLTRDPVLSYLPNQTPVVELGLAVNRNWTSKDGQKKEETCFVDCRAYAKQAEVLNQYMKKGRQILIEGRLHFSSWEDKTGQKRSKLRVVVDNFQFLGGQEQSERQTTQAPPSPSPAQYAPPPSETPEQAGFDPSVDDGVPF